MRKGLAAAATLAIAASMVAACSTNEGTDGSEEKFETSDSAIGTAEQSMGPADEVPGATEGGSITFLDSTLYDHVDPTQTYYVDTIALGQMFTRTLTGYRNIDGKNVVVGDMATDAGRDISDGKCTTWEYTLKDGLKYEDGSDIKSEDIAYNISRSFVLREGPQFFTQWLDGAEKYEGPFEDDSVAPGIETPDEKTIQFTFNRPVCDAPFLAAMSTTAPLPRDKDASPPTDYDKHPFASGPYKFEGDFTEDGIKLVRNDQWDAKTDPIRHQYLDEYNVNFGLDLKQAGKAIIADNGDDQYALVGELDGSDAVTVYGNEEYADRTVSAPNIFTYWIGINQEKITDLDVRKGLQYVVDKEALLKVIGGPTAGVPATTTLSPTVLGYKEFDAFPNEAGDHTGDKEKAKELIDGKVTTLTYAYRDTQQQPDIAAFLKEEFAQVGIELELVPLPENTFPTTITAKDHGYDLFMKNWGADWPTGTTVIDTIYNGNGIADSGNVNNIFFNVPEINDKIEATLAMPANEAVPAWGELDEEIMTNYAPMVPLYYSNSVWVHGSKVGGAFHSQILGTVGLTNLYAMK